MLSASCNGFSLLCNLVFDLHISQVVDSPTHLKGSILVLIISNSTDRVSNVRVHHDHRTLSNHFPVSFSINVFLPKATCSHPSSFLNYSRADFDGMCDFLLKWDFSVCYRSSNVETIWSLLRSAINSVIGRFVWSVSCTCCHSGPPSGPIKTFVMTSSACKHFIDSTTHGLLLILLEICLTWNHNCRLILAMSRHATSLK